jgi:hypothetical protein
MKQSELDYKQETGLAAKIVYAKCPDCGAYMMSTELMEEGYIEWLEEKYEHYLKCQQALLDASEVSKHDWDNAVNEIGQLQDQLSDAMDEIRQLSRR